MKCANCSEDNPAGEEFCKGCGVRLPEANGQGQTDQTALSPTTTTASGPVRMTFNVGDIEYQLRDGQLLRFVRKGSDKKQDGDIELDDDTVSGSPVEIRVEGDKVIVRDTGSSGGFQKTITVNPNQEAEVEPGDMLMLGSVVIATS